MYKSSASLEVFRWGFSHLPGAVFHYAAELELDMEDIGLLALLFYLYENINPLSKVGLKVSQIIKSYPGYSSIKLSRRLSRLHNLEVIAIQGEQKNLPDRVLFIEPLLDKLSALVLRDHALLSLEAEKEKLQQNELEEELIQYKQRIELLEQELEKHKDKPIPADYYESANQNYKKVADFISKKTGNLMSLKMSNELKKWLGEMGFTAEFLLCMLELCFERQIYNPREITNIARDLKEYSVNSVEGLELYFKNYVDKDSNRIKRLDYFDAEVIEFGRFTGVDMSAEARRNIYNKWRYDWGFSHQIIMKAGELMCQRTQNGGLEYIDSVLSNWMNKELKTLEQVEKEIINFKVKNKKERKPSSAPAKSPVKKAKEDYKIYVPPDVLNELKNSV